MMRLALVLVLAMSGAAHADLVSPGGKLRTRAGHVIGVDRRIELTVAPEVARLVSNIGVVDQQALILPDARFPQIAIVAALDANGAVIDWLAVPLAGQARVKVETARGASVVVRVAEHESAAFVAKRGDVTIPVVVPPGVSTANAIATARNGNVTEKAIVLGARPFGQTLAVCGAQAVTILAIEPTGSPAPVAPPISVTAGSTSAPRVRGPGWFEVDVVADVDAVAVSAGARHPSTCTITLPPIAPTSVRLVADRPRHVAGDASVLLRVELAYRGQRSRVTPAIELTTDTGTITDTRWALPTALAGKRTARAKLVARWPGGSLEHAVDIALAPAAAARMTVAPMARMRADGDARAEVVVELADRFGNPVAAATLRGRARGGITAFTRRADGAFVARYTAPHSRVAVDDRIAIVEASGVAGEVRVPLEPMPRMFATSVRAGMLATTTTDVAPLVAATAELRLPMLGDRISLGIDGGVTAQAFDAMAGGERVTGTVTAVPLLARAALHQCWGNVGTWLGGGAGIAVVSTRIASASTGNLVELTTRPALSGFAGASYRFGFGTLGLELGYLHATLPGDGTVQGKLGGVTGALGYRIEL